MHNISNTELRNRLRAYGFESPPVTETTRSVLEKKLHSFEQSSNLDQSTQSVNDNVDSGKEKRVTRRTATPTMSTKGKNVDVSSPASKVQKVTSRFTYISPISSGSNFGLTDRASEADDDNWVTERRDRIDQFNHSTPRYSNDVHYGDQSSSSRPRSERKFIDGSYRILIAFFVVIISVALIYYYSTSYAYKKTGLTDLSSSLLCGPNQRPNVDCIQNFGVEATTKVLDDFYQTLQEIAVTAHCENNLTKAIYPKDKLFQFIMRRYKFYNLEVNAAILGIIMVSEIYPNLSISYENDGFTYTKPSLPWSCVASKITYNLFSSLFQFSILIVCAISLLLLTNWLKKWRDDKKLELERLVSDIITVLQKRASYHPDSPYLPITYVNNELIMSHERKKKSKLWDEAVKLIEETESRIRKEIQTINGEDYVVWRWLPKELEPPTVPTENRRRMTWQGEAFGTTKGTINSPTVSPTPCLKIRHMFDLAQVRDDQNTDWLTLLQDAILERCEGTRILHIAIDESNSEGCIYVKCASSEDAGHAYRKMHGAWFDGKIVSVKYIRLERYHERFPESALLVVPLAPTNNLKRSLG